MVSWILGWLAVGIFCRLLCLSTLKYIQQESDGGGWDAGSVYSFYPDLPYERSLIARGAWHGSNEREEVLIWILAIIFWPIIFIVWCLVFPTQTFAWWLSKVQPGEWRGK